MPVRLCKDEHLYEKTLKAVEQVLRDAGCVLHLNTTAFIETEGCLPGAIEDREDTHDGAKPCYTLPRNFDTERIRLHDQKEFDGDVEPETL
jgi:hypothetical protein